MTYSEITLAQRVLDGVEALNSERISQTKIDSLQYASDNSQKVVIDPVNGTRIFIMYDGSRLPESTIYEKIT